MLTISEAQRRTELFLTGQMLEALRAVEYELPSFDTQLLRCGLGGGRPRACRDPPCARRFRRHLPHQRLRRRAVDAAAAQRSQARSCLSRASTRCPDASTFAVRLGRWRIAAEHAGWKFGWRYSPIAGDPGRRFVETYCYAFASTDFLEDEPQQLYWRTDIVQMIRYYMIEAARGGIRLSPRRAGFPV
jgi:hypothetical protein